MTSVAEFIRRNREAIIGRWREIVEARQPVAAESVRSLRDAVPTMLDEIAAALEHDVPPPQPLSALAAHHASERHRAGYDVRELVFEYQALRSTIIAMYLERGELSEASRPAVRALAYVNDVVGHAINDSVSRFVDDRDRTREMFLAIVGHDLRSPLQACSFVADALLAVPDEISPRALQMVARLKTNTTRMSRMIADILDVTRGRLGGGIPVARCRADLRAIVCGVVEEIAAGHPSRALGCAPPTGADLVGEWDPTRLEQLIANLVENALRHGGDPIVVTLADLGDEVCVEVANQGAIPPAALGTIFEPFDRPRGARAGGLGLGLYIVREIARAHGGDVAVRSSDDEGTVFSVRLPRRAAPPQSQW